MHKNLGHAGKKTNKSSEIHSLNSAKCLLRKKSKKHLHYSEPSEEKVWIYFGSGQTFTKNTATLFLHAWLCKSPKHVNLHDYLFKLSYYEAHTNTLHASLSSNVAIRNQNLQMIKQMRHGTVQIHVAWDQEAAINDNSGGTWRIVFWKYANPFW